MVTFTFSSSSSGPCGSLRAPRYRRCAGWSGSAGQDPVNGPGDNWSRVRDQRLKGQTGLATMQAERPEEKPGNRIPRSVVMGRRPGRPGRGPPPAGSRGRGDGCASGYVVRVVGVIVVVAVLVVEIVVEIDRLVLVLVVLIVVF